MNKMRVFQFLSCLLIVLAPVLSRAETLVEYGAASAARYPYLTDQTIGEVLDTVSDVISRYGGGNGAISADKTAAIRSSVDALFDAVAEPAKMSAKILEGQLAAFELGIAGVISCPSIEQRDAELVLAQHKQIVDEIVALTCKSLPEVQESSVPSRLRTQLLERIGMATGGIVGLGFKCALSASEVQDVLSAIRGVMGEMSLSVSAALSVSDDLWRSSTADDKALAIQEHSDVLARRLPMQGESTVAVYLNASIEKAKSVFGGTAICDPIEESRRSELENKAKAGLEEQFSLIGRLQEELSAGVTGE